ncbi:MAG: HAD-IA family hydrolase [Verrucomicrobia bacterium]|nr:HAD-IA family hydrolase [Verrucomicrobiota bacterium]
MLPRAITFDVGGTLIQPWPSVGHVYAEVAGRSGHKEISPERLNTQFAAAWKRRQAFDYSRTAWQGLVKETFAGTRVEPVTESFFDALYQRFAQPDVWRVFDDVLVTLEQLKRLSVRLGIISNWDERLRPLLGALKLAPLFEAIAISHEVGHTKPAGGIFRQAAQALQLPAEAILHVGDSNEEDFHGARAAGFEALLLSRRSFGESAGEINSLAALASRLMLNDTTHAESQRCSQRPSR